VPSRPATLWLALLASLITAVLPPAVVARTVCAATGRAALAWSGPERCALEAAASPPACCEHEDGQDRDGEDDCCSTVRALAAAAQPEVDEDPARVEPPAIAPWPEPLVVPVDRGPSAAGPLRATGPPEHAQRLHLGALRSTVLTI
jgi:hypothetical protein